MSNSLNRCAPQNNGCSYIAGTDCPHPSPCPTKPTKDHRDMCGRQSRITTSTKIVENLLDIGSTLVRVLINCGIHEYKAQRALDVIIYSFMFFEEVKEHPSKKCKKRIRKKEFLNDLMENCDMTKTEARMTYAITKAAFKAFYEQTFVMKYDASAIDPCDWRVAVDKTVEAFRETGATDSEVKMIGCKICNSYNDYLIRRNAKKMKGQNLCQEQSSGASCFCNSTQQQHGIIFQKTCKQKCGSTAGEDSKRKSGVYKTFCNSWLKATSDSNAYADLDQSKSKVTTLPGKLVGEYCTAIPPCCGTCQPVDTICNPVVVRDCLGRTYMMVQGNRVFFDPEILINEAKRVTADLNIQSSGEHIPDK